MIVLLLLWTNNLNVINIIIIVNNICRDIRIFSEKLFDLIMIIKSHKNI
jgi:hypothetical protein